MEDKNLEKLTEVDFERGIIKVIRGFKTQIQEAVNMIIDIDYYKSKGYEVKYYFNDKEKTYNFLALEKKVGFKYENNKAQKQK